ncbi:MAG: GNAT family N-acetyltransferase [bacterium]
MDLRFEKNPGLKAEQVADLRKSVGWDSRVEKYKKILGNTYFCAVCFSEDKLVGYIDVVSDKIDDAYVRDLMVHPDYQRRNIGTKLLNMVIEQVKSDGIKMINTIFDPELTRFYKKVGFTIMSGGVIDFENDN